MIPTLIDLHVRAGDGALDPKALSDAARSQGLDGLLLVGPDAAPQLPEGASNGVLFFVGAELDTDIGRLLCVPSTEDDWFKEAGWRSLRSDADAPYPAAAVAEAFSSRGGAVIVAQPFDRDLDHEALEEQFVGTKNLSAVVVSSSPRHTTSNERAVTSAKAAGLPAVAGSATGPGGERFGGVATIFAEPPTDQASLCAALRSGRLWPAELVPARESRGSADAGDEADDGDDESQAAAAPTPNERAARPEREKKTRTSEKKSNRGKSSDREDNRGNRLDPAVLRRPHYNPWDNRQPDFDPIAKLYGLADRQRADRWAGRSDEDLDRINGNRTRGNDPNVMAAPDFRELRAERQHVGLLLETIEYHDEMRDSVALRFAVHALERVAEEEGVSPLEAAETLASQRGGGGHGGGSRRKRRRRRN